MNNLSFRIIISMFILGLCAGSSLSDEGVDAVYSEAVQLIKSAQENEKTSYSEAFKLYQNALEKINKINTEYPTSKLAVELVQDKVKIASYSLTELKESIIPKAKVRAEAENSPLICAYLVIKNYRENQSGFEIFSSQSVGLQRELATAYTEAGRYDEAFKIAESVGYKPWFQQRIPKLLTEVQKNKSLEEAAKEAKFWTDFRVRAFSTVAIGYAKSGQKEKALEVLSLALQEGKEVKKDAILADIAKAYAQVQEDKRALEVVELINDAEFKAKSLAEIAAQYVKEDKKTKPFSF